MSLKYSTSQINKAGDTLSGRDKSLNEELAREILDYWRALHQSPLHSIYLNLSNHANRIDKNALVAGRLKRAPSIFSKLDREKQLTLRKMQDIGGCRAIVADLQSAIKLSNSFENSTQQHILERKKDYIKEPKSSGYRGIHLIYRFQSKDERKAEYNGLRVEVQIRSALQHVWATAVEIVGAITRQSLKSSKGAEDWLKFFQYMSEAIAITEQKGDIDSALFQNIYRLEKKLDVQKKMKAYSLAIKHTEKNSKANYHVLEIEGATLTIHGYKDEDKANEAYIEAEKRLMTVVGADTVLVGTKSFHQLQKAYPNYFGDSLKFVKLLDGYLVRAKKSSFLKKFLARIK